MAASLANDSLVSRHTSGGLTVWPVSLWQVKQNAQIAHADDDPMIERDIIPDAVSYIESIGRVSLITQTRTVTYDHEFPEEIETRWPLQSVTSLTYLDASYVTTTVSASDYRVLTAGKPGRVQAKTATPWPSPIDENEVVTCTYKAGFGDDATAVPQEWKRPVLLLASYWWAHRESYDAMFVSQPFFEVLRSMVNVAGGLVRYV